MRIIKRITFLFCLAIFLMCSSNSAFATTESTNLDNLYIEIGDALMNANDEDWDLVNENIAIFKTTWNEIKNDSDAAKDVTANLNTVTHALNEPNKNSTQIKEQLSSLSKSLATYDKKLNPIDQKQEKKKIGQLLPLLDQAETMIKSDNLDQANTMYQKFLTRWTEDEVIVRNQSVAAYGQIETQIAFIRIALSQNPPDKQKALDSVHALQTAINDFLSGNVKKQTKDQNYTLDDAVRLLETSAEAMDADEPEKASNSLNQLLLIWPVVEGKVRTKDPSLYSRIENDVPKAISMLNSQEKDVEKANEIVTDLGKRLQLIAGQTEYTFIDALLILLREGLEAILIIAGLLAFLKKTNNEKKQIWIWGGAFGGLIASAILAVCINLFFSTITAATSREYLEGIIGLVAVAMMLTVGAWLHKKTNVNHWNQYIEKNLCKALAKGSIFSMALLSFLSIFREGAETIIFYAGMAPSMEVSQLLLGIGVALLILVILGFVIIRYSAKIPLRPFFFVATWLIYLLSFKMLGVSVHALQVANIAPVHYVQQIPFIEFIGLYPTVETVLPQAVLLFVIIGTSFYIKKTANFKPVSA